MCHYNPIEKANVYNCSQGQVNQLPNRVQANTTWFINMNSNMQELCGNFEYLHKLTLIDVSSNEISFVCSDFISYLHEGNHEKLTINLQNNQLKTLPQEIKMVDKRIQFLISQNPFQCSCDMLWMTTWLNNGTTPSGEHIIKDYNDVFCHSTEQTRKHISTLQASDLGCYHKIITTSAIIGITFAGLIIILVISTVIIGVKRGREIRWLVYKNVGVYVRGKQDSEDMTDMGFDAFISYR